MKLRTIPLPGSAARQGGSVEEALGELANIYRIFEMAEEKARLERIIQHVQAGVAIVDAASRKICLKNHQAEDILGQSLSSDLSIDDDPFFSSFHPDGTPHKPEERPFYRSLLPGETLTNEEMNIRRSDGKSAVINVNSSPILDAGGHVVAAVLTFYDVTERKHAEAVMRRSEARYRHIVEDQTEMIWRYEPGGKITFVNDACCRYLAKSREELIGRNFLSFIHQSDRGQLENGIAALTRENSVLTAECRMILSGGEVRWQRWTNRAIFDKKNRFIEFQATGLDVTDRKKAEADLQKAHAELEAKVKERTTLLAETNRALLAEISERKAAEEQILAAQRQLRSLTSDLLMTEERERRRIAAELHDQIGQTLAVIKIKVESLQDLRSSDSLDRRVREIRELMDQSIQQTRLLTMQLSPPVLYELGFTAALEWLAEQFQTQYALAVEVECGPEFNTLSLDEDVKILLFQTIRELLMNVVRHAGSPKAMVIVSGSDHNEVAAEVGDDGVGFDVSQGLPRSGETGGYGLFGIRERLSHFGGEFSIRSEPGRGTTVTVKVPRQVKRKKKRRESYEH